MTEIIFRITHKFAIDKKEYDRYIKTSLSLVDALECFTIINRLDDEITQNLKIDQINADEMAWALIELFEFKYTKKIKNDLIFDLYQEFEINDKNALCYKYGVNIDPNIFLNDSLLKNQKNTLLSIYKQTRSHLI